MESASWFAESGEHWERWSSMTAMKPLIYVVEDEEDIAHLIRYNLALEGFEIRVFSSGEDGLRAVEQTPPDLIVLDLMLPGKNGFELCRTLKENKRLAQIPIVMVTAKGEDVDVVKGLELGADDYVTKPFSPKVLVARVQSVLRRYGPSQSAGHREGVVQFPGLSIHPGRHEVKVADKLVSLTHSEFQILYLLAKKPGWVFTRSQIVDAVRGENYAVTDRSIDFQMVGLRKKLGPVGPRIETIRGVGYRFKEDE